jgi:hypothetical protein
MTLRTKGPEGCLAVQVACSRLDQISRHRLHSAETLCGDCHASAVPMRRARCDAPSFLAIRRVPLRHPKSALPFANDLRPERPAWPRAPGSIPLRCRRSTTFGRVLMCAFPTGFSAGRVPVTTQLLTAPVSVCSPRTVLVSYFSNPSGLIIGGPCSWRVRTVCSAALASAADCCSCLFAPGSITKTAVFRRALKHPR